MSAVETASTEKNNSNVNSPQQPNKGNRLADVFVIVFCVTGAAFSLNLFRLDLFQSIATQNKKPMGAVTVKYNNVQRRFSDRVLWGRLTVNAPVYLGDLIRVAEYSSATLNINDGIIDINENSLIRIRASSDGEDRILIDLSSGSLSITGSGAVDGGIALNVMGRVVAPTAGATLSVSAGESGMTLQVNKGSVIIKEEDGQNRSMEAGEALILDTEGAVLAEPAAVIMLPRPNARFIKNSVEPVNVRFAWNAINIDQTQPLRLEIAAGPNFTRIIRTAEGIDFSNVNLDAGIWYWRLSYQNAVLNSGQFTIVDAAMSSLVSSVHDSQTHYQGSQPQVRFEWQPIEGVSYYILEAGLTPDITNPLITRQTAVASYVEPGMETGTWYWHVKPVFSSLYEGSTVFSQVSSFRIEKIEEPVTPSVSNTNPEVVIISSAAGWAAYSDTSSTSNASIDKEKIDGIEREVLTINANLAEGTSKWAGAGVTNTDVLRKLKNANGVRFKALGDGNKWRVYFATSDVTDSAYHGVTISTKNGVVSSIDISFNKLDQPDWKTKSVRFNKNNIEWINIEKNADTSNAGTSTIKIFDFETYTESGQKPADTSKTANSANTVTPPESNTITPDSSISNPEAAIISSAAGWTAYNDNSSTSNAGVAIEKIDGIEREVLTINIRLASGSQNNNWAGASTGNTVVHQKLKNANGVRFKVLGDGKKWNINFETSDVKDFAYHIATISTKKGEVSDIDIPYNKLRQPTWTINLVRFNKNNIKNFAIERNINNGSTDFGTSSIKIFDFEVY